MSPRPSRRGRLRVVRGSVPERAARAPQSALSGVSGAVAASLLMPGAGQFLQRRWLAGTGHLAAAVGLYVGTSHRAWPTAIQIGVLCAWGLLSATDAARAERSARRAALRLV